MVATQEKATPAYGNHGVNRVAVFLRKHFLCLSQGAGAVQTERVSASYLLHLFDGFFSVQHKVESGDCPDSFESWKMATFGFGKKTFFDVRVKLPNVSIRELPNVVNWVERSALDDIRGDRYAVRRSFCLVQEMISSLITWV